MNHKIKLKIGDKLLCKLAIYCCIKYGKKYDIIQIKHNNIVGYYIRCEDNTNYFFTDYQISKYFNIIPIMRRRKLEKLNSL